MAELRLQADQDAQAQRRNVHAELEQHARRVREELQVVLAASKHRHKVAMDADRAEQDDLRQRALAVLEAAERDAERTHQEATTRAAAILTAAEQEAKAQVERAERRLAEAEAGARLVRERTTAEVDRLQREAYQRSKDARDEAVSLLSQARSEADATRAEARNVLDRSRAEVAALAQRRDDINSQLGHLSGVIEALAVSEKEES